MKHYVAKEVICPFYKKEDICKIYCEGFHYGNTIQLSFNNKMFMTSHKEKHCNSFSGHTACPLYPIIERKCNQDG